MMAFHSLKLLNVAKHITFKSCRSNATATAFSIEKSLKQKEYKTENGLLYLEDPDNFGTLSRKVYQNNVPCDEGDVKEEKYLQNIPLRSQKLTIRQYADLIKQYVKYKRLKEAFDVLEVRMLTEDRVKPENYIYNILIGACADVGFTKKAFKLFNDMKRRALKPTGDTYTCLFTACINSPFNGDGLNRAHLLRNLMIEKGIEPNLTNYNVMIKAFGRCGDLSTAFKIVDEMVSKKMKIRVHTFNHLLQACISDKKHGLRHALIVWRKMLKMREKPNLYSFNLILKCVKDCEIGSLEDIQELIGIIQDTLVINATSQQRLLENKLLLPSYSENCATLIKIDNSTSTPVDVHPHISNKIGDDINKKYIDFNTSVAKTNESRAPNLLSANPNMQKVLSLQGIHSVQDKFAIIGGLDDFLKEMDCYSVEPDIKTFTQILLVLEDTKNAEWELLTKIKCSNVKTDIDFYNMLIKKRCLRLDYKGAFEVIQMIDEENKYRKKKHPMKKHLIMKPNIMTYGLLAMACQTEEEGLNFLAEMKKKQLKVNIEILGTLLKGGTANMLFEYVIKLLKITKEEKLKPNLIFMKHLEAFNKKCAIYIKKDKSEVFSKLYVSYLNFYKTWLKDINIDEILTPEHPWQQFEQKQPDTFQRQNIVIKEPKKFYKKQRRFVPLYRPRV